MAIALQEAIDKLLARREVKWNSHKEHKGGSVLLKTPDARRLFAYLLSGPVEKLANGDEEIFPGLIEAWEKEEYDPAADKAEPAVTAPSGAFRLNCIETEGFGGLNMFGGPPFVMEVDCQSCCLEGQNGSGKTSLASAILWALTGRRIREHAGPVIDNGSRGRDAPVLRSVYGAWRLAAARGIKNESIISTPGIRNPCTQPRTCAPQKAA